MIRPCFLLGFQDKSKIVINQIFLEINNFNYSAKHSISFRDLESTISMFTDQ